MGDVTEYEGEVLEESKTARYYFNPSTNSRWLVHDGYHYPETIDGVEVLRKIR